MVWIPGSENDKAAVLSCIGDNDGTIAVSYFHVELLPRSTPNHIPWTMLIGVPTM
jgi:hypothetical protein